MEQDLLDVVAEPVPDVTVPVRLEEEGNVTEPIQHEEVPPPCGPPEQRSAGGDVSGGQWVSTGRGGRRIAASCSRGCRPRVSVDPAGGRASPVACRSHIR
jgi:hypothetical protein